MSAHPNPANQPPASNGELQSPPFYGLVAIVVVMVLLFGGYKFFTYVPEAPKPQSQAATTAPLDIEQRRKPYTFGADQCVEVWLGPHWFDYPMGGKIKFVNVKTGQTVGTDAPGLDSKFSFGNGWYRICAEESKATGVDIFQ